MPNGHSDNSLSVKSLLMASLICLQITVTGAVGLLYRTIDSISNRIEILPALVARDSVQDREIDRIRDQLERIRQGRLPEPQ